MKVTFLDIDGVLNSFKYDSERKPNEGNIDESRLAMLCEITVRTGGKIVLSTSWRNHWSKNPDERDQIGKDLDELFQKHGLKIFDKTPTSSDNDRSKEIRQWLAENPVESFVILDDIAWGWGDLDPFVVKTNYRIGRGLEQKHVDAAIKVLDG